MDLIHNRLLSSAQCLINLYKRKNISSMLKPSRLKENVIGSDVESRGTLGTRNKTRIYIMNLHNLYFLFWYIKYSLLQFVLAVTDKFVR